MKKEPKRYIFEWAIDIVIAGIIVYLITTYAFQNMYVVGSSMKPTLNNGEAVLVNKLTYSMKEPSRYDIVAFKHINIAGEEINFVKRIIGVAGDKIDIIDHAIYINDEILGESVSEYNKQDIIKTGSMSYPIIVPKDAYFVLGDNKTNSVDSRYQEVGLIPKKELIGKIFVRIWPLWEFKIFK